MRKITKDDIITIHLCLFGIKPSSKVIKDELLKYHRFTVEQYYHDKLSTASALARSVDKAIDQHLLRIHQARVKLVSSHLPAAKNIIDLGGANGSIYEMGYPHKFRTITIVDLPPDERDPMYKDIVVEPQKTPNGSIRVRFGDMSDLSFAKSNSVDMVWSGESIEHVPEKVGQKTIHETFRVLRPGGFFCLDTPNGLLTTIHAEGRMIHPEHKIEYSPKHLQQLLRQAGFKITKRLGLRHMPNTLEKGRIDYTDFVLGSSIHSDPKSCYIQYYECVKPSNHLVASWFGKASQSVNFLRKPDLSNRGITA